MGDWVINVVRSAGYPGIVLLMFVENVFPPIPSEVIMPLAGYLVSEDELSMVGVVLSGMAGSVLGALPLYYAGRKLGEERLKAFADRHGRWLTLSRDDLDRAKSWFDRHGNAAVFYGRLVPGIRSLISIPAGIAGMNFAAFLLYTSIGTTIWTALLACAGYLLGKNFQDVETYLGPVSWVIVGGIILWYIVRVVQHRGSESATEES